MIYRYMDNIKDISLPYNWRCRTTVLPAASPIRLRGVFLLKLSDPDRLINYSRSLQGVMLSRLPESVAANRLSSHCRSCLTSGQTALLSLVTK